MRRGGLISAVSTFAAIGLTVGLVLMLGPKNRTPGVSHHGAIGAMHSVLAALSDTTDANSYAFDYSTTFQPATDSSPAFAPTTTSGHGVVNLNPYVMVTTNASDSSFPDVTAVFDSDSVWEFGAGNYGTGNAIANSPGNALPGFAQSVEGSLGQGQGALMMVSLANPMGRLTLDQSMIKSAQPAGTGTVDGVAVTNYQITVDLTDALDQPTLSDEQRTTITQALGILNQQGYVGTTEIVSIDAAGYIRETRSMATFSGGGSVSSTNTLSAIGCAGTVTPGRPVVTPAPLECVSPDQPDEPPATSPSSN
jgi:hypothetical protein